MTYRCQPGDGTCPFSEFWVVEGCSTDDGGSEFTNIVRYASEAIAGVRCCSMNGLTCVTDDNACPATYTHAQAEARCESQQLRLCTKEEMDNCCGTGGECDDH